MNNSLGGSRALLGAVIVGLPVTSLLEAFVQCLPPHYSAVSQSESALAVGPYGFLEAISLFFRGALTLVFLVAFERAIAASTRFHGGVILLGASAIGKMTIALVAADVTPRPVTTHGVVRALVAFLSFAFGALGELLLARTLRRDPTPRRFERLLTVLATVTLGCLVVVIGTAPISERIGVWGALERIYTGLFLGWLLIAAVQLRRRTESRPTSHAPAASGWDEGAVE